MPEINEEFEGGSGYPIMTEKILTQLPISNSFNVKRNTLISMEEDPNTFIRNEIKVRIEQFVVAEKLATDVYRGAAKWEQPATTWDMYKQTHQYRWWMRWLIRRRPVRYRYFSQTVAIKVERYAAYPDANVEFPVLGKPVPIEIVKEM